MGGRPVCCGIYANNGQVGISSSAETLCCTLVPGAPLASGGVRYGGLVRLSAHALQVILGFRQAEPIRSVPVGNHFNHLAAVRVAAPVGNESCNGLSAAVNGLRIAGRRWRS